MTYGTGMMTMKTTIELTKEQNECVNYKAGDLLIKGVAGSGKSYVILRRALKLYKDNQGKASIGIFTFTKVLVKYTDELLSAKLGESNIRVQNVDKYFNDLYYAMTGRKFIGYDKYCDGIITNTLRSHARAKRDRHRFYDLGTDFWKEEFVWIQEKCILSEAQYLSASRKGRGSKVRIATEAEKKLAWSLYLLFQQKMKASHKKLWPELYLYIIDNKERIPDNLKIDYVFLDEAQDLSLGKMRAIKAITKKTVTIAADMAQKIYKTTFTWKEAGIDIQGRASKTLTRTFRSTRQIVTLAEDLARINRKDASMKDEYTEVVLPESEGPLPLILFFESKIDEQKYLSEMLKALANQRSDKTIGILCKTRESSKNVKRMLYSNHLNFEEVICAPKYQPEWHMLKPGIKVVIAYSSKGLEFDTVIIPELDEGNYPFYSSVKEDENTEDGLISERNLLYVMMTRARESLFMLCTKNSQSRFISEFSKDHYKRIDL